MLTQDLPIDDVSSMAGNLGSSDYNDHSSPYYLDTDNTTDHSGILLDWNENDHLNITDHLPIYYAIQIMGHYMPFVILITIIANTLVVVVLSKRHMRSPTNAILLTIALSDTLMALFPAPWLFYMYTFENHYKPLSPVALCYAYTVMIEILPNLFHTTSIWLMLALAIQRYIYVCHAPVARTWCTMSRVLKVIRIIFGLAIFHLSTRFFDYFYTTKMILWEGGSHEVCVFHYANWMLTYITPDFYFNYFFWFRVIFVHMGPCIALLVLNSLLFRTFKRAQRTRLFFDESLMRDANSTTIMLIVVVTVFLFVEIPLAILTVLYLVSNTLVEIPFFRNDFMAVMTLFINFFLTLSFPIKFAIYCNMSLQFRETFINLFIGGATPRVSHNDSSNMTIL